MSASGAQRGGFVLVAAALVAITIISVGPTLSSGNSPAKAPPEAPAKASSSTATRAEIDWQPIHVASLNEFVDRVAPDSGAAPLPPPREEVRSPFSAPGTDSAIARCTESVRQRFDTSHGGGAVVAVDGHHTVRPPEHRGPDSLIVDGTGPGRDATPAVWHCAVTANASGAVSRMVIAIEDGWPGVAPTFDAAHALTVEGEDACLQQTKKLLPEHVARGVKYERVADTLHVTGDAFPLDRGDLVERFHCRALVRGAAVVRVAARLGK
jgi:hypothetical protein